MTFRKTVLAYLTGWLIVQPLYNRLLKVWRKRELKNPSEETRAYFREHGKAVAKALQQHTTVLWTADQVRNIAYEAAGAGTTPFMAAHPDMEMPSEEVVAGVRSVLRNHGIPEEVFDR